MATDEAIKAVREATLDALMDEMSDLEDARVLSAREADRVYTRVLSGRTTAARVRGPIHRALRLMDEAWPRDEVRSMALDALRA